MAQASRHIELADRYLQTSVSLQNGGFSNEAAEMVWGAVVNAIESIAHTDAGNHRRNLSNKARRDLARRLHPLRFDRFQTAISTTTYSAKGISNTKLPVGGLMPGS